MRKILDNATTFSVYKMQALVLLTVFLLLSRVRGRIVDFEEYGGIADDMSNERAWQNGRLMNETLNSLEPGLSFVMYMYNDDNDVVKSKKKCTLSPAHWLRFNSADFFLPLRQSVRIKLAPFVRGHLSCSEQDISCDGGDQGVQSILLHLPTRQV